MPRPHFIMWHYWYSWHWHPYCHCLTNKWIGLCVLQSKPQGQVECSVDQCLWVFTGDSSIENYIVCYYLARGYQEIKFEFYVHPMPTLLEITRQLYVSRLNVFSKLLFSMRSEQHWPWRLHVDLAIEFADGDRQWWQTASNRRFCFRVFDHSSGYMKTGRAVA